MSIIRSPRKEANFTIIANSVCLDNRLSMRALGLLVRLLSRPDNWCTNSESLAREFNCGRDQIRNTLQELSDFGYMELQKTQDSKGFWSSAWMVFDEPTQPTPEKPTLGQPTPEKPTLGESGAITSTELTRTNTNTASQEGFDEFWKAYPKKMAKPAALKAFRAAKIKDIKPLLDDIEACKDTESWQKSNGQFIPYPATYLNQRRWEKEDEPVQPQNRWAGAI